MSHGWPVNYVVPLSTVGLADTDRVGHKAATLGELRRAGFAVPDGFVVVAGTLAAVVGPAGAVEHLAATRLPEGLREELEAALAALGGGPVAVRSSGVDEDLAGMSYAGQYESVLDVHGPDAVAGAVRTCWASAYADRVAAYRGAPAADRPGAGGAAPALAVLVQAMVPADAAGVAFGRNPVTGDAGETVVSAVRGLGDRLMSGAVDADEWTVRAGAASRSHGDGAAVDAATVGAIADLAARVGARLGAPQDVEWAVAEGRIWLLQARPITAGSVPIEVDEPDGFATRHPSFPRPWVSLQRSLFLPVFDAACRHVFAYTTGIVPQARMIGGWVYVTAPPDNADALVERLERIAAAVARREPQDLVRRWHEEWKPRFAQRIERLRGIDLGALSDTGLAEHLDAVVALFGELHDRYFRLTGATMALLGELGSTCAQLFGWSVEQTLRLRGGLAGDHMTAAVGVGELARMAAARPAVRELLDGGIATVQQLSAVDADFGAAVADYVHRYSHRTVDFDITEPTLAEQPGILLNLIRAQLDRPYDFAAERAAFDARVADATAEAWRALAERPDAAQPDADRSRFASALADSSVSGAVRDEKVFYAVGVWALLRYAVLELGRRLVAQGAVDRPEDVFFLELAEALPVLESGADQRPLVRYRRGQHTWALAHPGPPAYGVPPAPVVPGPDTPAPSPGALRALLVAKWTASLWRGRRPVPTGDDGSLRGIAASAGRYVGPVRVITGGADFGRLRAGDVLVCPETTAQWAVLFPSIGALVTDRGSLLSHPSILAREYGVPAVVATGRATSVLRDGQVVVVDGTDGSVWTR